MVAGLGNTLWKPVGGASKFFFLALVNPLDFASRKVFVPTTQLCSHQYINKRVCLCSNKIPFTETGILPHFADPSSSVNVTLQISLRFQDYITADIGPR